MSRSALRADARSRPCGCRSRGSRRARCRTPRRTRSAACGEPAHRAGDGAGEEQRQDAWSRRRRPGTTRRMRQPLGLHDVVDVAGSAWTEAALPSDGAEALHRNRDRDDRARRLSPTAHDARRLAGQRRRDFRVVAPVGADRSRDRRAARRGVLRAAAVPPALERCLSRRSGGGRS